MQRIIQNPSSIINNSTNQRIYTRFHRKPQIYPTNLRTNRNRIENTTEQENMNNYISNIYKEKKYRGVLDPTSPNNKNIFIDTDSEHQKSERDNNESSQKPKKSAKLLIAKTESQFPETYNSQNIFKRDGVVRGYYIKVNENKNILNNKTHNTYNTLTKNTQNIRTIIKTPSPESEKRYMDNYNKVSQTQIIKKRLNNLNNLNNQTYNRNTLNNGFLKREIDLDEWPTVEKQKNKLYYRNKDIQIWNKEMKSDNSNNNENEYVYQYQNNRFPAGMVYRKGNISEMKGSYSKSNISDNSEENNNQYKKPIGKNYIIAGNPSETGSPMEYRNNNYILGTSEEESDHQAELIFYGKGDYQNYMNNQIIKENIINNDMEGQEQGGKVDLYYGIMNKSKDIEIPNNNIMNRGNKNINLIYVIKNDNRKLNLLKKLQRFIKSYLFLREICAMKIQAVWRGGNTRRIMDLYNDLDEFIYHLSKVQFNHFNNDFCFFIKQLFNIYKANISNANYRDFENKESDNGNEEEEIENENENENENCMNQISMDEIEKKEDMPEYVYKFPEGSGFAPKNLELENEIALSVEASSPYSDRKQVKNSKEYKRLAKDYEELYNQYNELKNNTNNNVISLNINQAIPKKEKNESESTNLTKSDYKIHKLDKFGSNNKKDIEKKQKIGESGKNLTISNDYDADLDNRDDDFFNQDVSYDDKDNSGYLKDKRYSYFSIHSDENSKYFDNENPKEKENKEGEIYKINTSKNSGNSKYNNNSTKNTGCTGYSSLREKPKLVGLHRTEKINKNEYSNSPSIEKSNNYIGHHSKTLPRKFQNYYDYSNNSTLIIPKHEEDFNIINNKLFLSPKDNEEKKHIKNARSDIAITPIYKFEDKNWNEIIEYIKNEEIEIPTKKELENIRDKKLSKQFDVLEKENNGEINIDNIEFRNKKLSQIYIEHENELKIGKSKNINILSKEKEKSLVKTIEDKDNQINLFKEQLEELINKMKQPKIFDSQLEINNNLNELNINGKEKPKIIFEKENNQEVIIKRKPRQLISFISKNNEFSIDKTVPETAEELIDTSDLIPKQIKITTKKIVKKTDTIQYRFKNTLITSENEIKLKGKEKLEPILEEETQENNRFSVENIIKVNKSPIEEIKEKEVDNNKPELIESLKEKEDTNIISPKKEIKEKEIIKVRVLNPEDLQMSKSISYIVSPSSDKKIENYEIIKNNEIRLSQEIKREIKIVTKKTLKKTNFVHSRFNDNKAIISSQNQFDIKGIEKESQIKELTKKLEKKEISPELISDILSMEGDKLQNIKEKLLSLKNKEEEEDNNENDSNIPKFNNINKKYNNIINKKSQFTINRIIKKPKENIINTKSKFTINGIQKEPIELKEEGIQFEDNRDNLSEKMTDTNDLIPKEIKIITKKTIKKTQSLKKHNDNIISSIDQIKFEGIEKPEIENIQTNNIINSQEIIKEKEKEKDWNKLLKKDFQHCNFFIKRISKNIYSKYKELKNIKEKEKEKLNEEKDKEEIKENKDINIPEEKINEKTGEIMPKEKIQQNTIIEKEIPHTLEQNIKSQPKQNIIKENIIVKKINFNIIDNKDISQKKQNIESQSQPHINEKIIYMKDWIEALTEDIQQNQFMIERTKPNDLINEDKLKEIEKQKQLKNEIQKNEDINIKPINTLPLARNKIIENWKDTISEEKSEMLNIQNQPKKKEIKITTRKMIKKTNNIYKKFNGLSVSQNELNIEKKPKSQDASKYSTENIHINIDKSYEQKKIEEFDIEKNKELFINANEYKKKEIKIRTKKTVAKTNYLYKRFNNNLISKDNQINIKAAKPQSTIISSFGNEKLEKVEDNQFSINKTEDNKKMEELKNLLQKEAEAQLQIKLLEEKKELQDKINKENEELKRENEELKTKLEKGAVQELEPMAIEEFILNEKEYSSENEEKHSEEKHKEDNNYNNYSLDYIQFIIVGNNKPKIETSEQGIQLEDNTEKEEKMTDTFDLEKREIKITSKKILKKTNVLRHLFKNNSICSDLKININNQNNLKERNKVINKVKQFTINKDKKEEDIKDIKEKKITKNLGNNIINKVISFQFIIDKLQKPKQIKTEEPFGDNQLSQVILHNKSQKKIITDKYSNKSASYDNIINIEDNKNIFKKRKVMNTKLIKVPNKKKKFSNLIIKLDNKFDIKNCFNKWNTLTPNLRTKTTDKKEEINDTNKKKAINLKQMVKDKNLKLNTFDNNERRTDTTNIEKSNDDSNTILVKINDNNFDTINTEDKNIRSIIYSNNCYENKNNKDEINQAYDLKGERVIRLSYKRRSPEKIQNKIKKLNINNKDNLDIPNIDKDSLNKEKEININEINNNNLNSINSNNEEDNAVSRNKNTINTIGSLDNNTHSHLNSLSNDMTSSIEVTEKSNAERTDQENSEKLEQQEQQEEPKKKEIIIKKKVCIISKKAKKVKIKNVEAKKKFFEKRFLIKFWKIWKNKTGLAPKKEIQNEDVKSIDQKITKKPFTLKLKRVKRRIIESGKANKKENFLAMKNRLMSQNKPLIVRHFFLKWKNEKKYKRRRIKDISIIENILRRHIVRYLVMHGKILKFKTLLMKYALTHRHK